MLNEEDGFLAAEARRKWGCFCIGITVMLVKAIDAHYHRCMHEFVELRNGVSVPEDEIQGAVEKIADAFNKHPELMMHFSILANNGFDTSLREKYLTTDDHYSVLECVYNLHVGPVPQLCTTRGMARTAIAANMIVVEEYESGLFAYLVEPVVAA
jgi:hypothetical protein